MKISIKKRTDVSKEYDLILFSGHFTGVLEHISEDSLKELQNGISDVLSENNHKSPAVVWNPRANRHDYVDC